METSQPSLRINPVRAVIALSAVSLIILVFSLLGQRPFETGNSTEKFFRDLFTTEFFVNNGENIATFWNMFILIVTSALILIIASVKSARRDPYRRSWWTLGAIFLYFAMDALSGVSHRFITLLKNLPTMEGGFLYNWLYPLAAVIVLLALIFFVWFYLHLDAPNKILFPISIGLYTLGAYKAELLSGHYAAAYGSTNTAYLLITHAEEFAEYFGIILMIHLLLTYLRAHVTELELTA